MPVKKDSQHDSIIRDISANKVQQKKRPRNLQDAVLTRLQNASTLFP